VRANTAATSDSRPDALARLTTGIQTAVDQVFDDMVTQAERRLGIADQLAAAIPDGRDASRVVHLLPAILRASIFGIACGYEDADDLHRLRFDPALKLACGRLPDTGRDLCSQPTVSRWENVPSLRDLIRLMGVMVDLYCASYPRLPKR
jgi:hypothetical protein